MAVASGTRLGPYEILSPIGAGGMGEVYRARDTKLDRDVAIKVLPASLANDADALARLEREARAVAQLSHPNILAIFDFGRQDDTAYAVMELLEGETLRARLAHGALPARKSVDLAVQIADGLAAAHEKGIVHRDLKPENVFVTGDGRVKLLDFGLARQITVASAASDSRLATVEKRTDPGTVMGTVGYMSPEQVRGEPADHRSDIFSFGAVLYEMLSGRRAFARDTAAESMAAILKEDPPDLTPGSGITSSALSRIVEHCLEKKPGERFQSARDIAFDLRAHSGGSAAAAGAGRSARRRLRFVLPAAIAALLAATTVVAWVAGRAAGRRTLADISFRQLTLRRQTIFAARFVPGGRTIVFSASEQGQSPELFVVTPESPDPKPLGLRGTHLLSVSPKGELAVLTRARYVGHSVFRGTLARMPLEGGAPRDVLENVREADWSPDGSLAVIRELEGKDRLEFPIGKVLCETGGYLSDLRFSPLGDRLAFLEHPFKWDDQGKVAVVDVSGKKSVLSPAFWGLEGIAWTPDGKEVLFSGGSSYTDFFVHAVTMSGRSRVALQSAGGLVIRDAGRDGRWLVARDETVAVMPVLGAGQTAERGLEWLDGSYGATLSDDGKTVVFSEENGSVGPSYTICLRSTDGSPVVRLGDGGFPALSPDGKRVLAIVPASPQRLMLYPTGAGEARPLASGGIEAYESTAFFPDGKTALVCGHERGRGTRCYSQAIPGGEPRPITPEGTTLGIPSPDGRRILASAGGAGLIVYPVEAGTAAPVPGTGAEDNGIRWSADGRSVLVYRRGEIPARVERIELASGRRTTVRTLGPADLAGVRLISDIAFTPDERSYAYTCSRTISHLFLAEGAR